MLDNVFTNEQIKYILETYMIDGNGNIQNKREKEIEGAKAYQKKLLSKYEKIWCDGPGVNYNFIEIF
jgi:hypothetical protein